MSIETFSSFDCYVPFVSTVTTIDRLCKRNHSYGIDAENLTTGMNKDDHNIRYLALIPVIGNLTLIVIDSCRYTAKKYNYWRDVSLRKAADQGDFDAMDTLCNGTTAQKEKAFECYFHLNRTRGYPVL